MKKNWSFIDLGKRDFLRDGNGRVIQIEDYDQEDAEDWLLDHGFFFGWTNKGTKYICWDDEE